MINQPKKQLALIIAAIFVGTLATLVWQNYLWLVKAETVSQPLSTLTVSESNEAYAIKTDLSPSGIQIFVWTEKCGASGFNNILFRRYNNMGEAIDSSAVNINASESCIRRDHPVTSIDKYGNFVLAWEEGASGSKIVKSRAYKRLNPAQALIGTGTDQYGNITVAETSTDVTTAPRLALTKNKTESTAQFIVGWLNKENGITQVATRQYNLDFSSDSAPLAVSDFQTLTDDALAKNDLALTYSATQALAVWSNVENSALAFQVLNANGTLFGPHRTLYNPADTAYVTEPSVAGILRPNPADGITNTFIFSWTRRPLNGGHNDIYIRKISCNSVTCDPDAALNSENIAVRTNTANLSANTSPANSEVAVYQNQNDTSREYPDEAKASDNLTVIWEEVTESTRLIRGQNYSGNMSRTGDNFLIETNRYLSSSNTVALDEDGDYTVVYSAGSYGVYAKRYNSELYKRNSEKLVNTQDTYSQSAPAVAVGQNGNYVITYSTASASDAGDIIFKLYNKNGEAILNTTLVNTTLAGQQMNPQVAFFKDQPQTATPGKFIVVWQGNQDGNYDIYYQIFNADGSKAQPETKANSYSNGDQINPKVAAAQFDPTTSTSQEFIIVWEGEQTDDTKGIGYLYHNNLNGNSAVSGRANGDLSGEQFRPDVTLSAGDNSISRSKWAITWQSSRDGAEIPSPLGPGILKVEGTAATIHPFSETRVHADSLNLTSTLNQSPAISCAELNGNLYYAIAYQSDTVSDNQVSSSQVLAKTYHHGNAASLQQLTVKNNLSPQSGNSNLFSDPKVVLDKNTGNALFGWTSYLNGSNALFEPTSGSFEVAGAFYRLRTNLENFGPSFRINSYRANDQSRMAIGLDASSAEATEKIAVATWINSGSTERADNNGIYQQILNYPLFFASPQNLQPQASQEVDQGGKYLIVPDSIDFGTSNPNSSSIFPVRDINSGVNYIEITDLDGVPFNLTIDSSDLTFSTNTISKNLMAVQNGDQASTELGLPNIQEVQNNPNHQTPPLLLHSSTVFNGSNDSTTVIDPSWPSLENSQTLATKSSSSTGQWRIFPRFKLIIPSGTPIGTYTGTLTFTLI